MMAASLKSFGAVLMTKKSLRMSVLGGTGFPRSFPVLPSITGYMIWTRGIAPGGTSPQFASRDEIKALPFPRRAKRIVPQG